MPSTMDKKKREEALPSSWREDINQHDWRGETRALKHRSLISPQGRALFLANSKAAFPTVIYFLVSFAVVYSLFGINYSLIQSVMVLFFLNTHAKRVRHLSDFAPMFFLCSGLIILGFISTTNFALRLVLNGLVPFLLTARLSSQTKQMGYFAYSMLFVWLTLLPPPNLKAMGTEFLVFLICFALLVVGTYIYQAIVHISSKQITKGYIYRSFAQLLRLLPQDDQAELLNEKLFDFIGNIQQVGKNHQKILVHAGEHDENEVLYLLIQRLSYVVANNHHLSWSVSAREMVYAIADLLDRMADDETQTQRSAHLRDARHLLTISESRRSREYIFCRSFVHGIISWLREEERQAGQGKKENYEHTVTVQAHFWTKRLHLDPIARHIPQLEFLMSDLHASWRFLPLLMRAKFYELRFAARLSLVVMISVFISSFVPDHGYWIIINAFVLCRPAFEESALRLKTRFIGSMLACAVIFFIPPEHLDITLNLVISAIIFSLLYCATPGSATQAFFATLYALMLASFTLPTEQAAWMRIVYLCVAIMIVFVVNRFFFPGKEELVFRKNLTHLVYFQQLYWKMISERLRTGTTAYIEAEIFKSYHSTYIACLHFLDSHPNFPHADQLYDQLMSFWNAFSEIEQCNHLIKSYRSTQASDEIWRHREEDAVLEVMASFQTRLTLMRVDTEGARHAALLSVGPILQVTNPDLTYLFNRYSASLEHMVESLHSSEIHLEGSHRA